MMNILLNKINLRFKNPFFLEKYNFVIIIILVEHF